MGWFDTIKSPKLKRVKKINSNTPVGHWKKCSNCGEILQVSRLQEQNQVCPYCQFHFRLGALERVNLLIDGDTFRPFGDHIVSSDPLKFVDRKKYRDRLEAAQESSGPSEAVISGLGEINGLPVSLAVMNFQFMGGSMGVVAGEKLALTMDMAYEKKIPAIIVTSSGGARMQEGILSLMQMAKTSASRHRLRQARLPYISVLTDPTTGGCAASFAMLGDIHLAEPKALIGFAGPRVIEQSIRQSLPDGFQRSEFLHQHGFVDRIVHRKDLKREITFFLRFFLNKKISSDAP